MAEPDYVTVARTLDPRKFLVVVMHDRGDEEFIPTRTSQALPHPAAHALAESWASALKVEIR